MNATTYKLTTITVTPKGSFEIFEDYPQSMLKVEQIKKEILERIAACGSKIEVLFNEEIISY